MKDDEELSVGSANGDAEMFKVIERMKERIRFYKDEMYKAQKKNEEYRTWYGSNIIPNHNNEVLAWSKEGPMIVWYSSMGKYWVRSLTLHPMTNEELAFLWQEIKYTCA